MAERNDLMPDFAFHNLDLKGAYLIENFYKGDTRGWFTKSFEKDIYEQAGICFTLSETFISNSSKNVIRGLHFQTDHPQSKLVSVLSGRVWDVIVDVRPDSPTLGQWRAHELSAENHKSFYIPSGFAHGFASLEDNTVMLYQCDGKYSKETDTGIIFNDPDIGIEWPVTEHAAIHSERDLLLPTFREYIKALSADIYQ